MCWIPWKASVWRILSSFPTSVWKYASDKNYQISHVCMCASRQYLSFEAQFWKYGTFFSSEDGGKAVLLMFYLMFLLLRVGLGSMWFSFRRNFSHPKSSLDVSGKNTVFCRPDVYFQTKTQFLPHEKKECAMSVFTNFTQTIRTIYFTTQL